MPTTYAHWRFGGRCIPSLPEELQQLIQRNRAIFDYGVHGPDIYFYYNCLVKNDVNRFGTRLHDIPFAETLQKLRPRYIACDNKEAALAYLLGFVCHFTLDSYCHGYIERKEEVSGVSHGKLESQFDRYLLLKDGLDPIKTSTTTSLKPSLPMARVIAQLFTENSVRVTYQTIRDQKMYLNLLKDDTDVKRWILEKAMDIAHTPSFKELLITKQALPEVYDAMLRLDKLSESAAEHYPELAKSLIDFLEKGEELDVYFHNHFCPKPDYKDIPVLPVNEERLYTTCRQE